MKKKLIATLVAGAVLSTGLIGLTACGNSVKLPKGSEVADEAAWQKAFMDTLTLENYTYESSNSADVKINGTISKLEYNMTAKVSAYSLLLLDTENNKAYSESTNTIDGKGKVDDEKADAKQSSSSKEYYELKEKKDLYSTYWRAKYSKSEEKSIYSSGSEENYWQASTTSSLPAADLMEILEELYESKDGGTAKTVVELYDKFTYSGGVYSATLYMDADLMYASDVVECEVKVSISDGHVAGISYKVNKTTGNTKLEGYYDLEYTYSAEAVYAITNVGSTDVSKKVNKDITKAIDKAKKLADKVGDDN